MKAPLINELKARRQTLGWSIRELGERCGIDEKLLSDCEQGIGSPRLDTVETWAAALGLTLGLDVKPRDARPGVRIDWDHRVISVDGSPVRLTPMEWKALERLAKVPGELVTHESLFRHLYGDEQAYRVQSTAIRVLITKLRRLLPLRIEARWGRGYIVSGIESQAPAKPNDPEIAPEPAMPRKLEPSPERSRRESIGLVPHPPMREPSPSLRDRPAVGHQGLSHQGLSHQAVSHQAISHQMVRPIAAAPVRPSACRAEELGVIEQFLAERGVTRCPDVATIQRSPLPTLVWDKIKRKWVRPAHSMLDQAS